MLQEYHRLDETALFGRSKIERPLTDEEAGALIQRQETGEERHDAVHSIGLLLTALFLGGSTIVDQNKDFGEHPRPPAGIRAVEGDFHRDFLLPPGEEAFGW